MTPPWMLGAKEVNKIPMLVCHFQNGELEGLDNLQGGPSIDPETGIREYSALSEIIEIPEIKELFHKIANQVHNHGDVSPQVHNLYEKAKHHSLPYRETPDEEHNPLHQLERTGRKGDTKLALIPLNLAFLLIELHHVPSTNPETGLLEFGFFKELLRVGGTIGGALLGTVLGGPVFGTAIGAGLGNTAARYATGTPLKESAVSGLKNAGLAYGLQGIGQAAGLTGATPFTGNMFGGGQNFLARGLGELGLAAPAMSATFKNASPQTGGNNAIKVPPALGDAIKSDASGSTSSAQDKKTPILDIMGKLAPLASAGLAYMGERNYYKNQKQEADELRAQHAKERRLAGLDVEWKPLLHKNKWKPNPAFYKPSKYDLKHGIVREPAYLEEDNKYAKGGLVKSYSKGTLVRGMGKGQDDKIKTTVPDGSYIIDASSTSMFGDGSSQAGAGVLKNFEQTIQKKCPSRILKVIQKEISKTSKQVPVWLSDSEYKFDPLTVTILGRGSNKHGADILRHMVKEIRKDKIRKGTELPPKAKHPIDYIKI